MSVLPTHWLLEDDHEVFRGTLGGIVDAAAQDLCGPNARLGAIGDEHDQCQQFFVKLFTLMQERTADLTDALLCCSKVPDPVLVLGYYRSRVRRRSAAAKAQFVESETGADFALTLDVNLPGVLESQRSVLGQAKLLGSPAPTIAKDQLRVILQVAGAESAVYMVWDETTTPTVIPAANVASHCRLRGTNRLDPSLLSCGKPFAEFLCDAFLALWFGRDYEQAVEGDQVPERSVGVVYHFLHRTVRPPNVVYLGVRSAESLQREPGVDVWIEDLSEQDS